MLRIKTYLLTAAICWTSVANAAGLSDFLSPGDSENNQNSILGIIQNYYQLNNEIKSKEVELEILSLTGQSTDKASKEITGNIQSLGKEKAALTDQLEVLKSLEEPDTSAIEKIEASIDELNTQIEAEKLKLTEAESRIVEAQNQKQALIEAGKTELENLEAELDTTELRLQTYVENFVKKILLAASIWLFAMALKWVLFKIFNRIFAPNMTAQRRAFIEQLIKIAINTIAFVAILIVFFSQLITVLPYFAIFATVVTLALKDVILSVIAWIIIGTKDGYKVGHYLHIGSLWGTVVEINPFNTIVRQGGISGPTGRLLTFPNKKIFEEFLENWSKWHNFTYLKWDFYLEQGSNYDKAEKIMLEVLAECRAEFEEKIKQKKNQLLKLGITDEDLAPMAFWEIQANGVLLRGKMLVDFDDFFTIRTKITRNYLKAISKEKDIQLRFVNNLIPNEL